MDSLIIGIIVTGAVAYCFSLLQQAVRIQQEAKLLRSIATDDLVGIKYGEGEAADKISTLREKLGETGLPVDSPLGRHIDAIFRAGVMSSRLDIDALLRSTERSIFRSNATFRSVLGLFIVAGLLGTILSLITQLPEIAEEVRMFAVAAPSGGLEADESKIGGLGGALWPSLCGVLATIVGVIAFAAYQHRVCAPFMAEVEHRTLSEWVPRLMPDNVQTQAELVEELKVALRRGTVLVTGTKSTLEEINAAVGAFRNAVGEMNRFQEGIRQTYADAQTSAEAVRGTVTALKDAIDDVSGVVSSMSEASSDLVDAADRCAEDLEETRHANGEIRKLFRDGIKKDAELTESARNVLETTGKVYDRIVEPLRRQVDLLDAAIIELRNQRNLQESALNSVCAVPDAIRSVGTDSSGALTAIATANRAQLVAIETESRSLLNSLVAELRAGLPSQCAAAITDAGNAVVDAAKGTIESLKNVSDKTLENGTVARQAAGELHQSLVNLHSYVPATLGAVLQNLTRLVAEQKDIVNAQQGIADTLEKMREEDREDRRNGRFGIYIGRGAR